MVGNTSYDCVFKTHWPPQPLRQAPTVTDGEMAIVQGARKRENLPYTANPPTIQPSIGPTHAPTRYYVHTPCMGGDLHRIEETSK